MRCACSLLPVGLRLEEVGSIGLACHCLRCGNWRRPTSRGVATGGDPCGSEAGFITSRSLLGSSSSDDAPSRPAAIGNVCKEL